MCCKKLIKISVKFLTDVLKIKNCAMNHAMTYDTAVAFVAETDRALVSQCSGKKHLQYVILQLLKLLFCFYRDLKGLTLRDATDTESFTIDIPHTLAHWFGAILSHVQKLQNKLVFA